MLSGPSPGAPMRESGEMREKKNQDIINRGMCPILRVHIHTVCFVWLYHVWVCLGCSGLLRDISPYVIIRRVDGLVAGSNDVMWMLIA